MTANGAPALDSIDYASTYPVVRTECSERRSRTTTPPAWFSAVDGVL